MQKGWTCVRPRWLRASAARMVLRLELSVEAERDFGLIVDHLLNSWLGFGEVPKSAFDHAETRVLKVRKDAERILIDPHQGQRHDDIPH